MAFGDVLDFFGGGGETDTSRVTSQQLDEISSKNVARRTGQTTQIGGTQAGTTDIRRLSREGEAGGLEALNRILSLSGGRSLTEPGRGIGDLLTSGAEGLRTRALGIPERISEFTQPIIAERRRTLQDTLDRDITARATSAGSRLNSFVDVAAAEGAADLESQLAALEAQLNLQGIQLESQDLLGAQGALGEAGELLRKIGLDEAAIEGDVGGTVANLITALRGATEVGETRAETQQTSNVANLIQEITDALRNVDQTGQQNQVVDAPNTFQSFASGFSDIINANPFKVFGKT